MSMTIKKGNFIKISTEDAEEIYEVRLVKMVRIGGIYQAYADIVDPSGESVSASMEIIQNEYDNGTLTIFD